MRLKSYVTSTVESAVSLARQELGPEAVIVKTQKTVTTPGQAGRYEVVFGFPEEPESPRRAAPGPGEGAQVPSLRQMTAELVAIRQEMHRVSSLVHQAARDGAARQWTSPELGALHAALRAQDVEEALCLEALRPLEERRLLDSMVPSETFRAELAAADGQGGLREQARAELARLFRVDAGLGRERASRRVAMLVGPPGAGKTTALVKLAARNGVAARVPTHLITLDTERIGAAEQMRAYAAILGATVQAVEGPAGLAQALDEHRGKGLVLIDTPGFGPREADAARELGQWCAQRPDLDVQLVLPATGKPADLRRAAELFRPFAPQRLLFTRVDETASHGALLNEAHRAGLPLSFLCAGQQVPEDLEPATAERVLDLLLPAVA